MIKLFEYSYGVDKKSRYYLVSAIVSILLSFLLSSYIFSFVSIIILLLFICKTIMHKENFVNKSEKFILNKINKFKK